MAYVLGFFAADGNMIRNKRGAHFVTFYSCDKDLLELIQSSLLSDHKVGSKPLKPNQHINYQLQIGSKEIFADLLSLGMSPAKSKTLSLPHIPQRFQSDFVRGYFDGDGGVYFNRLKFADRKNPRYILMTKFTSGSRAFLEKLHALLKTHNVQRGSVREKWNHSGYDLTLSHRDSVALFHFMYSSTESNCLYLARKKRAFENALQTLYGTLHQPFEAKTHSRRIS